jgi:Tol biopolymer transport system component
MIPRKHKLLFYLILFQTIILFIHIFAQDNSTDTDFTSFSIQYMGQESPGMTPEIFAPGIVSTDANEHGCAFYPDGREFYFTRIINSQPTIMVMKLAGNKWSAPQVASFSGQYNDRLPSMSPDGNKLFFESIRPYPNPNSKKVHKVWMVQRTGLEWGKAQPVEMDFDGRIAGVSMSGNGTLYGRGITRFSYQDGHYRNPVMLDSKLEGDYPFIAPDESYILYCSGSQRNITVSFHLEDGAWTEPQLITSEKDTYWIQGFPIVSPDGRYLFFTANHNIYWLDAQVIEKHRPPK